MRLLDPWTIALGWERFMALRTTHLDDFKRLLRQPQHFISLDNTRFAPIRLVRELGQNADFPVREKDPVAFSRLRPELAAQGWLTVEYGQDGFDAAFKNWSDYCLRFGADNYPRKWSGNDPSIGRSFTLPGSTSTGCPSIRAG